ncbi:hypothetical protein I2F27_11195 [Acinetobacter sp. B5B]|uniref:hypothetical protein n=1 Tax=Acinetobacter baretiae TaxID=2605383 RepID=UPI0018C223C6|nr:hypothetical protein [Acinetobacter baretiae]MBF7683884.1 hypothetical protein [Acinetobacter baretiae]
MKKMSLIELLDKYSREELADLIGCHLTLINHVVQKKRKVYIEMDDAGKITKCYEIKSFPNRKLSESKKVKSSSCN